MSSSEQSGGGYLWGDNEAALDRAAPKDEALIESAKTDRAHEELERLYTAPNTIFAEREVDQKQGTRTLTFYASRSNRFLLPDEQCSFGWSNGLNHRRQTLTIMDSAMHARLHDQVRQAAWAQTPYVSHGIMSHQTATIIIEYADPREAKLAERQFMETLAIIMGIEPDELRILWPKGEADQRWNYAEGKR